DGAMSIAGYQNGWLADIAADYCTAAVRIGDREAKRTSRHSRVRSVTRIWRGATRGGDVYRSRASVTQDRVMTLACTQRGWLTDCAAHYCAATIGIGYREAERTSRHTTVRSVTRIWRGATRSGDVYRSSATETEDRIMTLTGTQRWWLTDRAAHYCAATIGIGYREAERTSRYTTVRSVTRIWRGATRGGDVYRSCATKTADGIMRLVRHQSVGLANQHARSRARTTVRIGKGGRISARSQTGEERAAGYPGVGNVIDCDRVRRGA